MKKFEQKEKVNFPVMVVHPIIFGYLWYCDDSITVELLSYAFYTMVLSYIWI